MSRPWIVFVGVALFALFAAAAEAQIYVVEDADGNRRFTSQYEPGARVYVATRHTSRPTAPSFRVHVFKEEIDSAARQAGIEPLLVEAVIAAESNFDPWAVSDKGAQGLMQLMPATARRFRVSDVWDPGENIRGGVAYLKELMGIFPDVRHVLAAYNAGERAVVEHGGIPPYRETREYVRRVLDYYKRRGGNGGF